MVSNRTSAAKLIVLSLILCGLLRLALLDPLGIGAATASFLGNDRATVTHVVMVQFKQDIGGEAIDYVSLRAFDDKILEALTRPQTRERMINLQFSCAHPYTGMLYIGGIDAGGPPEGFNVCILHGDFSSHFLTACSTNTITSSGFVSGPTTRRTTSRARTPPTSHSKRTSSHSWRNTPS